MRQERLEVMMDSIRPMILQSQSFIAELKAWQEQAEAEAQAQAGAQPAP